MKPHIIKNECFNMFKHFMAKVDENFLLVPPHVNQQNTAERVIQTFMNHFISLISRINKYFPMHFWCQLIPQECLSLNMLRKSRINTKRLAYSYVNVAYGFNDTHDAPPVTRVVVH